MDTADTVDEIEKLTAGAPSVVSRERLSTWMASDDLEVQGATYLLLRRARGTLTTVPPLAPSEYLEFYRRYLERVMREGSSSLTRHEAGYEVVSWFVWLCDSSSPSRDVLTGFRDWLASLYRGGAAEFRQVLVNAVLEHLFERPDIRKLFNEWRDDPVLGQAFSEASLWSLRGGQSPLTGGRRPKRGRRK